MSRTHTNRAMSGLIARQTFNEELEANLKCGRLEYGFLRVTDPS